jgi:DNA polymerase-3 subunit gamma/tau
MLPADTLIRYIRILSELSNQLRYAVQKRVMVEVALIKLCKPQMDQSQDFATILQRLDSLEKQLEKGVVQQKVTAVREEETHPEDVPTQPKKYPGAVSRDIREIIKNWHQILTMCSPVEQVSLQHTKRIAGENGELILQFTDPTEMEMFQQDSCRRVEELKTIIRNAIGKEVEIQVRLVSQQEDAQYADIGSVIHFEDIEII